jgi:hypothetical protein
LSSHFLLIKKEKREREREREGWTDLRKVHFYSSLVSTGKRLKMTYSYVAARMLFQNQRNLMSAFR